MNAIFSFQTIRKAMVYASVWGGFAIIHALVMAPLVKVPFGLLLADGFIFSTLFILIEVMYNILVEGKISSITISPQTVFNYISLGAFILLLWLGSGLFLLNIFFLRTDFTSLMPTIPVRILIGVLLFTILLMYSHFVSGKQDEEEEPEMAIEEEDEPDVLPLPDEQLKEDSEMLERIAVKCGQKIHVILIPEIFYLQSDGDYVIIYTEKGKYLKEQTMKYFEEHLPKTKFVRVHRSCIVNVEMISRIELYKKQQQMLTLKNGLQIKTSVAGYKTLKLALQLK
jgi:hypothetical protein